MLAQNSLEVGGSLPGLDRGAVPASFVEPLDQFAQPLPHRIVGRRCRVRYLGVHITGRAPVLEYRGGGLPRRGCRRARVVGGHCGLVLVVGVGGRRLGR